MFDKIAPIYDHLSWLFLPNIKRDILNDLQMNDNDKVLDVGGGTGKLIETMLEENPRVNGYVLDKSNNMLKRAPSEVNVIVGDSSILPFESDCFDFIFCIDALHHFENQKKGVMEMIRVSKTDGEIIILELDPDNYMTKFVEYGEKVLGEPSNFYEKKRMKDIFRKKGFRVGIKKINFFQYIIRAKR